MEESVHNKKKNCANPLIVTCLECVNTSLIENFIKILIPHAYLLAKMIQKLIQIA